jgi:putative oxidoreductase
LASGNSFEPFALSLLRLVTGFAFSLHGYQKLFGFFGGVGHGARAHLFSMLGAAGVLETFGGLLILLGLYTRPVAFILCGEMAVAYFMVHVHMGPWLFPLLNMGEITVLYCFFFLYLVTTGSGAFSLDGALRKKT